MKKKKLSVSEMHEDELSTACCEEAAEFLPEIFVQSRTRGYSSGLDLSKKF